jgi:hypothetical protein
MYVAARMTSTDSPLNNTVALFFGEMCEQAIDGGRLTLSDIVKPMSIVSFSFEFVTAAAVTYHYPLF